MQQPTFYLNCKILKMILLAHNRRPRALFHPLSKHLSVASPAHLSLLHLHRQHHGWHRPHGRYVVSELCSAFGVLCYSVTAILCYAKQNRSPLHTCTCVVACILFCFVCENGIIAWIYKQLLFKMLHLIPDMYCDDL